MKRAKGIKRNQRLNRYTRLNPVSRKRRLLNKRYAILRKEYLELHSLCEFKSCAKIARHIHHRKFRGKYFLDSSTFMACCPEHHRWITDHGKEAAELGYVVREWRVA